jgi:N-acetylglucosaminyldiphosphoundecaprenol N-acetyl-beta-D-mannosaminyltransferase
MGSPTPSSPERIRIGGLPVDRLTLSGAVAAIDELVAARRGGTVFTPNVDHVVEFQDNEGLRDAYEAASLSLADGMPIVWASRMLDQRLPEKVSGSDLVLPLARHAATRGWRLFLLGGNEGVAERAKARMEATIPGIQIVGTASPRIDMREPPERRAAVLGAVKNAAPDIVLVAFGAPKQELFMHESREELKPAVLLGVGASLDFVAGTVSRAPAWISNNGLEWLYRLAREPRRLWHRYLVRDPKFLFILLESLRRERAAPDRQPGAPSSP